MNRTDLLVALLLFSPLVSAFVALVIHSNKLIVRFFSIILSLFGSILLVYISTEENIQSLSWKWLSFGSSSIEISFEFNQITLPLALATSLISLLINMYSTGFFTWDNHQPRYWSTLNFFTFSMLGLILSANLFQTFIFWELVALASYLLISFYRDKPKAAVAGSKALIINKIGDAGFIIALMAIYASTHTFDINFLESKSLSKEIGWVVGIGLCLAIFSKSAQVPFHTWLPDAMEGPTPISALMHSATMVAAGVFLLIRFHFLIPTELLEIIALVGLLTAIVGGLQALRELDLKKLLAWSTISQLGLMVMVAGTNNFLPSYLYLLSHALFKAGLFLIAGVLISTSGLSSIKELKESPKSTILIITLFVLTFSLMGFPLTIGFMAKEYIVGSLDSPFYTGAFFFINAFTVLYAARILSIIFPLSNFTKTRMESIFMVVPILILGLPTLWFLYSFSPFSVSWITDDWGLPSPTMGLTIFSVTWVILLTFVSLLLVRKNRIDNLVSWMPTISLDHLYQTYLIKPILFATDITQQIDDRIINKTIHGFVYANFSIALLIRWLDKNLIDGLIRLIVLLIKSIGNFFRQFVAGKIQDYIWWTIVTLILLFIVSRF